MVTVRGDDMTDKQILLFDERAEHICDNVRKLNDMTKLVQEFKGLAADLVNSNFMLYCYIPEGANGLVGWTFRDEKVKEKSKPSKFWLGLGLEFMQINYYITENNSYIYTGIRADAAWPLSGWFALGGTVALGNGEWGITYKLGPLSKFTFPNGSAILAGFGCQGNEDYMGAYLTLGYKFNSPWYITLSRLFGEENGIGLGVGYSICGGRKK